MSDVFLLLAISDGILFQLSLYEKTNNREFKYHCLEMVAEYMYWKRQFQKED